MDAQQMQHLAVVIMSGQDIQHKNITEAGNRACIE